jgi:hypothetical protein
MKDRLRCHLRFIDLLSAVTESSRRHSLNAENCGGSTGLECLDGKSARPYQLAFRFRFDRCHFGATPPRCFDASHCSISLQYHRGVVSLIQMGCGKSGSLLRQRSMVHGLTANNRASCRLPIMEIGTPAVDDGADSLSELGGAVGFPDDFTGMRDPSCGADFDQLPLLLRRITAVVRHDLTMLRTSRDTTSNEPFGITGGDQS